MMFSPESCVVVIVATAILHNISTRDCMPAPEVDEAANDIDGDAGDGEEGDRQQNNRNDGVIVRDNLMRAVSHE